MCFVLFALNLFLQVFCKFSKLKVQFKRGNEKKKSRYMTSCLKFQSNSSFTERDCYSKILLNSVIQYSDQKLKQWETVNKY